ncbi:nucleotidyltransferase domain-containing protein [Flavobacterium sp. RSP49]|uniref:nucleotidyltransferase family protein n=1 Tax=unclassified Flavobacterium TaxID=196869 RepID=UPI000F829875|nr:MULTISPECIES: nucleotidyltransferase domain-containing protein [unclassified Flavobacterium]RTY86533.1 nucleotidyltransferase domain-containing protein [Flavobacterium sp. RSP15]RTY90343.1 nucleotidyltransferase domain-containing protein [Flavobacterium sp. RSP46]RTZ01197.1 nucleotidyltransferase domain-containing protein [Flavobacterium sp. RSP49]
MILINQNKEMIKRLCKTHNVEKLYLFGSATTTKFNEESDIDFLVKFKSFDLKLYFLNYIDLKTKLKHLLQREIDLVEEQTLKNPYLISSIEENKQLIYG